MPLTIKITDKDGSSRELIEHKKSDEMLFYNEGDYGTELYDHSVSINIKEATSVVITRSDT